MAHTAHEADNSRDSEHDTREQILDAAQALFMARGYKAVAMRDIAEAVHITSAALYYHFPQGKEEVLLEMIRAMMAQWKEQIRRAIAQGGTLDERLRRIVRVMHGLPFDRLPLIMRDIAIQMPDDVKMEVAQEGFDGLQEQITAVFQQAIDAGAIIDTMPAFALAQLFAGMILTTSQNIPVPTPNRPELANADEIIVAVLLRGISPRP